MVLVGLGGVLAVIGSAFAPIPVPGTMMPILILAFFEYAIAVSPYSFWAEAFFPLSVIERSVSGGCSLTLSICQLHGYGKSALTIVLTFFKLLSLPSLPLSP